MSTARDNRFHRGPLPAGHEVREVIPAVDRCGHELWLAPTGDVECVDQAEGDEPGDGWVRLYRAAETGGAA